MKLKIIYVTLAFLVTFTNTLNLLADMAMSNVAEASMVMAPRLNISDLTSFYKTEQKKRKLTSEEAKIFNLAIIAADVFSVADVEIHNLGAAAGTPKEKMVDVRSIVIEIERKIKLKPNWDTMLSAPDLEKASQISGDVKETLGENSYTWAWLSYQKGDKGTAKEILNKLFETQYTSTMKLKNLGFRNSNPIRESSTLSKVLTPLSTPAENKDRETKLQKMKVHVSNLPDLQIMT